MKLDEEKLLTLTMAGHCLHLALLEKLCEWRMLDHAQMAAIQQQAAHIARTLPGPVSPEQTAGLVAEIDRQVMEIGQSATARRAETQRLMVERMQAEQVHVPQQTPFPERSPLDP